MTTRSKADERRTTPHATSRATRRVRKGIGVLVMIVVLAGGASAQNLPEPPAAIHGMLVVGTQGRVYLLHLAMRTHPAHQFQLIMEAEFVRGPATALVDRRFVGDEVELDAVNPGDVYVRDRTHDDNEARHYTFVPADTFVLTEIPQGTRATVRGHLVRGHFELPATDPTPLLRDVEARIVRILYVHDLREDVADVPHPLSQGRLEYLLFGGDGEYFAEHRITLHAGADEGEDNAFHQVFELKPSTAQRLNFDVTRRTVLLDIDAGHATPAGRLPEAGGSFAAHLVGLVQDADTPLPLDLELEREHYLEVLF
jgi:hypothetical protein